MSYLAHLGVLCQLDKATKRNKQASTLVYGNLGQPQGAHQSALPSCTGCVLPMQDTTQGAEHAQHTLHTVVGLTHSPVSRLNPTARRQAHIVADVSTACCWGQAGGIAAPI